MKDITSLQLSNHICYSEIIDSILNSQNTKYIIASILIYKVINNLIDSNYSIESNMDINNKSFTFKAAHLNN